MKRILFLFLPLLPYLASAQVAKDTVTVLTLAQIPAGAIRDTTNLTFVQDNAFNKARFDSLARYVTSKLIGDRGDITVSGATGLTWELDAGVVDSMQLSAGAVVLPGAKVTGTLPVSKGGTGATQFLSSAIPYSNGTQLTSDTSNLAYNATNNRLGIGTSQPTEVLHVLRNANEGSTLFFENLNNGNVASARFFVKNNNDADAQLAIFGTGFAFNTLGSSAANFGHLLSNGANSAGLKVGTQTDDPLIFGTNASERARMLGDGDFLIGYTTDNGAYPLQVNGQIFATNATIATSDERYKENIQPLQFGLSVIQKLNPVTFNFITDGINNFSLYPEVGFIAQEVDRALATESYAKSIVKNADDSEPDTPMGLATTNLIPLLVKAIQEQQAQIEALKARITQLENK